MKNTYNFFAFDLGASSGRSILGTLRDGKLTIKELTRFPNSILRIDNKYYWNIYQLFTELKSALKLVGTYKIELDSIGIDTWGVDFVYLAKDGSILNLPRAYRDPYTSNIQEEYFQNISKEEVYDMTGIQFMDFNSIFQLYAAEKEGGYARTNADSILFIPDTFIYMLTGKKINEYTIASTSQLLNPFSKTFEEKLLSVSNVTKNHFNDIVMPGTVVGELLESITEECNITNTTVAAVASHDTASAVIAVPTKTENYAYLSSGTWSLIGIEVKNPIINELSLKENFTNEGGVDGTIRFLKNITGMWLLEQCMKEWGLKQITYTYDEIVELSESVEGFQFLINPDDKRFVNPQSMTSAIKLYCMRTNQKQPQSHAEIIRCIFDSLALKYKYTIDILQRLAPFKIERLHVIGGGSQNNLLNQATANAIGMPVEAGPSEATAIGNIMMQAKSIGVVDSIKEIRSVVAESVHTNVFYPKNSDLYEKAYEKFLSIIK